MGGHCSCQVQLTGPTYCGAECSFPSWNVSRLLSREHERPQSVSERTRQSSNVSLGLGGSDGASA